jgi:antibiotic biosynthesis monooxygenase (ABM) superfamily enzyme
MLFRKGELVTMTVGNQLIDSRRSSWTRTVRGVVTEDQSADSPHVLVRWFDNGTVSSAPADWMIRMNNAV